MDKAQKQLINTYYRKRNLAAKENILYDFKDYEIDFGMENKKINSSALSYEQRTIYYNNLWGTNYIFVYPFGEYGGDVALINNKNRLIFVNKQGEPDITGIDINNMDGIYSSTAYNDTKKIIDKQNK